MSFTKVIFCLYLCCYYFGANAQETLKLTLDEAIAKGQGQTPSSQLAKTRWTTSRSVFRSTMANYKPQITLNGTVPQLERSNLRNILPNGQQVFVRSASIGSTLGLLLEQDISRTGGTVFVGTNLDYFYNFASNDLDASSQFATDMIFVGLEQPLFGFNSMKWDRELAPIRYSEATRQYAEQMESISLDVAELYFDVFASQLILEAAKKDKLNADSLYIVSKGRFSVGRIAETDLLQIELSSMNANARLATVTLSLQSATEALRNFFGIKESVIFDLVPPTELPLYILNEEEAIKLARNNRSKSFEFQRRLLEAERNVDEVRGTTGFQANLFARVGLSQNSKYFDQVYRNPQDAESITLGFQVPIADWGKTKARMDIAESRQQLERMSVEQERITVDQQVLLRVNQFNLVREQVALALRAYEVSEKGEEITRKRYLIGKIGVTELNLALQAQNAARQSYVSALQAFWLAHYELRGLTLYDFVRGVSLVKAE
ncbi:MAG: outer membrane protein [Polaribacter sp.]|jgi:outer membrane protein TolC